MELTANAMKILRERYLLKSFDGTIKETPEAMIRRVAHVVAQAEKNYTDAEPAKWEEEFFRMMESLEFLPNSPTLMNAGNPIGQLSACFVLPVPDSLEGIFQAIRNMALVQQTGGGTGFSFSELRPSDDIVSTTGGFASGPVSFMRVFDSATESIKQGGRRRGANMGVLRINHPDIVDFILCKMEPGTFSNFNISVAVSDSFIEAYRKGVEIPLVNPRTGKEDRRIDARYLFDLLCRAAWETGDPGIIFLDRVNRDNPTPALGMIEATNPCGEVPLLSYESCNLASINLSRMLKVKKKERIFDFERFGKIVEKGVRFLDDVIDVNRFPLEEISQATLGNRKIGLGIMGFADLLIQLGIPYDSTEALKIAEKIISFMRKRALEASVSLAEKRKPFPNYPHSIFKAKKVKVRNACRLSIAPTGTISLIAATSSGIEPLFAVAHIRKHVLGGKEFLEVNPLFVEALKSRKIYSEFLMEEIARKGSVRGIKGVPDDLKKLFVTALDIPPMRHLKMQAVFQKHVDSGVAKTVNMKHSALIDHVKQVYLIANKLDLKGVTIYRYGSKQSQVLNLGIPEKFSIEHLLRCDPDTCLID
ncbi:MAG: adenosylcobalamin-dependent ribonucleoside-diphosphate reductase [Acidobacteriota bacterium]